VSYLTPKQVAKELRHSRNFVMDLIESGELAARDERRPGATLPRYRIEPAALDAWKQLRAVVRPSEAAQRLTSMPRLEGVLRKRIAARRARYKQQGAAAQTA
jgi:excisionase family DNA binding protein